MGQEHKEYTWNLIAKKLNGEATAEELRALEVLLRNNPELHYPLQTISDLWKGPARGIKKEAEMAFSRHLDRMKELKIDYLPAETASTEGATDEDNYPWVEKRAAPRRRTLFLASLGGALLVGLLWFTNRPSSSHLPASGGPIAAITTPAGNEIFTSNGSRTHLALPDGTLVWLNAGSHLTYDKNFGSVLREVNLTGEAFFDVAKNAGKPFLIHTARIDIKVLGTSFNVKSYPTDRSTETTLLRGSIEVSIKDRPSEKIILKPNEKLVVANDDSTLHRSVPAKDAAAGTESLVTIRKPTYEQATGAIIETSWVDNKLIFREEAFGEVSKQMERWYGVTIRFGDPGLERLQFTGSFKEETIQQALEALKLTAKFNYTIEGTQVILNK